MNELESLRELLAQERSARLAAEMELALRTKSIEEIIANVAQSVSVATGESFLRSLVEHLSRSTEADFAFIGELLPGRFDRVKIVAMCADGQVTDGMEYELRHSPCENVVGKDICCY